MHLNIKYKYKKYKKYKTFRKTHQKESLKSQIRQKVLKLDTKNPIHRKINWNSSKFLICALRKTMLRGQKTSYAVEKIFTNQISDKDLVFRTCKELPKLNSKNTNNPAGKWAKGKKRQFAEYDLYMANKHMKRYLTSLVIRKMKIRTTMK